MGFNAPKPLLRTAMVNLDISKAFDAVSHDLLLEKISESDLNSNIVRWLKMYIRGRTAVCLFQDAVSKALICHSGMPQGGVLSTYVWNFYVSDFPNVAEEDDSYADDFGL
jgi:retron-type reverse transcriptase